MKTIWQGIDRQGIKYFASRPEFLSGFDVFVGKRCKLPKSRKSYRLLKRFKAKVTGPFAGNL